MIGWILIAALVFGGMFLLDKGFTKTFRNTQQHKSGLSVRLHKRYATAGLILAVLSVLTFGTKFEDSQELMIFAGFFIGAMAVGLLVYYMTFGIFYDEDSFVLSRFGKSTVTGYFKNIRCQQLYLASGNVVVELHMNDGSHFQVHTGMTGMYAFMDHAFQVWLQQTGRKQEDCAWYDPDNSCWFPPYEG